MKKLILALTIPCVALLYMTLHNQNILNTAKEFEFEIEAYDPRSLLSGHYLRFRIKYPIDTKCPKFSNEAAMCVSPEYRIITDQDFKGCDKWIPGRCNGPEQTFVDALNQFYVTEDKAKPLEEAVQKGKATIKVAVGRGSTVIKDLFIDGKSWKDF